MDIFVIVWFIEVAMSMPRLFYGRSKRPLHLHPLTPLDRVTLWMLFESYNMETDNAGSEFDQTFLYSQLDAYPWAEDEEFQGGLRAILGSVQDPAQVEHLTLRAKCYYYARKAGQPVDFDGYTSWVESGGTTNGTTGIYDPLLQERPIASTAVDEDTGGMGGGLADAPKPASFAEICALIQEGKPIPGIKDIPDTVLEGQASESQTQTRRKPWEKTAGANAGIQEQQSSWMQST
jgi:hypothetical protein